MQHRRVAAAARRIATCAHAGQVDKAGVPYIRHPARVALKVREHGEEARAVAWLHDVLEDTPVTAAELKAAGMPDSVVEAVEAITRRPYEPSDDYYGRVRAVPLARLVKAADIDDNLDPARTARLDGATRDRLARKYAHAREVLAR